MDRRLGDSSRQDLEEILIGLDQLTQVLEVRLAQANRLKQWLYQRAASSSDSGASARELLELKRLRSASMELLKQESQPTHHELH